MRNPKLYWRKYSIDWELYIEYPNGEVEVFDNGEKEWTKSVFSGPKKSFLKEPSEFTLLGEIK